MITNQGALHIKQVLANIKPRVAQSIAYGISDTAASSTDQRLGFEIGRQDILLTSLDSTNDNLIFKTELLANLDANIYELAIYSSSTDVNAGPFTSKVLTNFDSVNEMWVESNGAASTFTSGNSRVGGDSLSQTPTSSNTQTSTLTQVSLDLDGYSDNDQFAFAYNVNNSYISTLTVNFLTDANNYYSLALGTQTVGYKFTYLNKGAASATGSPSWSSINQIQVVTKAKSTGAASIDFDAIAINDTDTVNPDYVMVARTVLPAPFAKDAGEVQEVEYALDLNIG